MELRAYHPTIAVVALAENPGSVFDHGRVHTLPDDDEVPCAIRGHSRELLCYRRISVDLKLIANRCYL